MSKSRLSKMVAIVFVYCAATAITLPAQTLATLVSFNGTNGASPQSSLIQGTDGNFYGTTLYGGANNLGAVFKVTPSGALTTLHNFDRTDGAYPWAGLVQGTDGNFYGTTQEGGRNGGCNGLGCGTVFKITPIGALTTLYSFCSYYSCTDGQFPDAVLVQATDGNFYGTTYSGGARNGGTVFKITSSGTLTTLYSFANGDGAYPNAGLIQATDGNFYGTTDYGGTNNFGTVFKVTPSGSLTTLYSFCSQPNCADGGVPDAGLVQATDGNFYGTTLNGGANNNSLCTSATGGVNGCGTAFKITPAGILTTLYSFCSQPSCADGIVPGAGLVQATDGNFYGTTIGGGANNNCTYGTYGCGTVFKVTPGDTLTTLHSFGGSDGIYPEAGLVQATNGSFYGTTLYGGTYNDGTVFSLSVELSPSPVQFIPVMPCRLVDTRQTHDPIQSGTWRDFVVPQLGGCNIPTTAAAYSLNVTVVPHEPLGYLTIWPAGKTQPYVSTMNSPDGRIKANAAVVPAGANGAVSVYATNTTDLILDIDGYFTAPGSGTYQPTFPF